MSSKADLSLALRIGRAAGLLHKEAAARWRMPEGLQALTSRLNLQPPRQAAITKALAGTRRIAEGSVTNPGMSQQQAQEAIAMSAKSGWGRPATRGELLGQASAALRPETHGAVPLPGLASQVQALPDRTAAAGPLLFNRPKTEPKVLFRGHHLPDPTQGAYAQDYVHGTPDLVSGRNYGLPVGRYNLMSAFRAAPDQRYGRGMSLELGHEGLPFNQARAAPGGAYETPITPANKLISRFLAAPGQLRQVPSNSKWDSILASLG